MHGWARVAELTKAKNREGGFVVRCTADSPFALKEGMQVCFVPPRIDAPREGRVDHVEMMDERRAFVLFDTVRDLTTAELLVGSVVLARADELPQGDFPDCVELEGYMVHDSKYGLIGAVQGFQHNPAHPLLVVATCDGEVLIPCVEEFVHDIDADSHVVITAVPDGLLDLNRAGKKSCS